jgi:hypothetical protein
MRISIGGVDHHQLAANFDHHWSQHLGCDSGRVDQRGHRLHPASEQVRQALQPGLLKRSRLFH